MHYFLMNKNTPLLKLTVDDKDSLPFKVVETYSNIPIDTSTRGINFWFNRRESQASRKYIDRIYKAGNIKTDSDFLSKTRAISLNDTFWIKQEKEPTTWEDISPYSSPLNTEIADIAIGNSNSCTVKSSVSPEFCTDGTYAKCWRNINNGIYLVKRGSEKWNNNTGNEPFSEYFTCQVASALGIIDYVDYDLSLVGNKVVSLCKLFTDENYGFTPFKHVKPESTVENTLDYMRGIRSEKEFRQMLLLDCLVYNTDRHSGNYGFLVDNRTLKIVRMSPIFDNNLALLPTLPYTGESRESILDFIRGHRCPATMAGSFLDQAKRIMTPELYKSLLPLQKFKFKQHPRVKFDQARLDFLGSFVRYNVRCILKACKDLA